MPSVSMRRPSKSHRGASASRATAGVDEGGHCPARDARPDQREDVGWLLLAPQETARCQHHQRQVSGGEGQVPKDEGPKLEGPRRHDEERGQDELGGPPRRGGTREPGDGGEQEAGDEGIEEPLGLNERVGTAGIGVGEAQRVRRPDGGAGDSQHDAERKEQAIGVRGRAVRGGAAHGCIASAGLTAERLDPPDQLVPLLLREQPIGGGIDTLSSLTLWSCRSSWNVARGPASGSPRPRTGVQLLEVLVPSGASASKGKSVGRRSAGGSS